MSTTLDDFFGDGRVAVPECLYCGAGEEEEELIVSISDVYGPTHWHHASCYQEAQKKHQRQVEASRGGLPDYDADTAVDGIE